METLNSSSRESSPVRAAFGHKLIIYREGLRLGEWGLDEVEALYAQGLLYLSDQYGPTGSQERTPLKKLFAKPQPKQSIFSKST
jgi:hypothetical protein